IMIKGPPNVVPAPANPEEFDYRQYLQNQQIYFQHFLKPDDYSLVAGETVKGISYYIKTLRKNAIRIFYEHIHGPRERAIALALILGVKNELDPGTKQAYAASGAMHVLAVSGLHVGMIYLVVLKLFGWIRKVKSGNIIFALLALSLLWVYAGVTGMPASVFRAVTMLSVIILSQINNKQTNIYNSLAIAAVILLAYDPLYLFSVGFQLSFLAVTGIIYLFPRFYHLVNPESKIVDKIWGLCCIAFAAQLATFPLSIYYFHQFPLYFFLSNLVVIPAAFLILSTGLALLAFEFVPYISDVFAFILEKIIWLVNQIIFALEFLPHHIIQGISIDWFQTMMLYLFIFSFVLFIHHKKFSHLLGSFFAVLIFFIAYINDVYANKNQKQIVFYNINNHTAIDFIDGDLLSSYIDDDLRKSPSKINYHITPYRLARGFKLDTLLVEGPNEGLNILVVQKTDEADFLVWNGKKVVILNKSLNNIKDNLPTIETDYLVLKNNTEKNLKSVIRNFKVMTLVIDGSNNAGVAKKLESEAKQLGMAYHSTRKSGALIVEF
ncbi:MAG: ComEC family competence protein, partial [Bacteroidota bacterium]|nr:ComEC family competence protein [Bacteroidota bacterium]